MPEFDTDGWILHLRLFAKIQFLSHEIILAADRMIFKRPEYAVPELFVKWSCLKTEGVKVCIRAAALYRIEFRTLYQFPAKPTPAHWHAYRKRPHTCSQAAQICPIKSTQYLSVFVPEKESHRIPFRLSGGRNAIVIDNRLSR